MKYFKQLILICFATISLLFCFTQPVYARMGSSGGGGGGSTTTNTTTGGDSSDGDSLSPILHNHNSEQDHFVGLPQIIFASVVIEAAFCLLTNPLHDKKIMLFKRNLSIAQLRTIMSDNGIRWRFDFQESVLIDTCLNVYQQAQIAYCDALEDTKSIKRLHKYLNHHFYNSMRKEIHLKRSQHILDDVKINKMTVGNIATIELLGKTYLIMTINCTGQDKEVANDELKHYQSSWTDVGIFDITQRNHVRLSNLVYGNS